MVLKENGQEKSQEEKEHFTYSKITKANRIGHNLRRNCLLKRVTGGNIEEEMEVTGMRGRRRNQLLNDFKERIR